MIQKSNIISIFALLISGVAGTATILFSVKQNNMLVSSSIQSRLDARKQTCISLSGMYASQSWAYKIDSETPDPTLREYANKSASIVRAIQLCQIDSGSNDSALLSCVTKLVDDVNEHKVSDTSPSGNTYVNLVC